MTGTLSLSASFAVDEQVISPIISIVPDWVLCPEVKLLADVAFSSSTLSIENVQLHGLTVDLPVGDLTFSMAEAFAEASNSTVTGKAAYSGRVGLSSPLPGCCGAPGRFSIVSYTGSTSSTTLFGWGLLTSSMQFHVAEGLSLAIDVEYDSASPIWSLTVTTQVLW